VDSLTNGSIIPQLKQGEKIEAFNTGNQSDDFTKHMISSRRMLLSGLEAQLRSFSIPLMRVEPTCAGYWKKRAFGSRKSKTSLSHLRRPFRNFWVWNEIEAGRISLPPGDEEGWNRVISPHPPICPLILDATAG